MHLINEALTVSITTSISLPQYGSWLAPHHYCGCDPGDLVKNANSCSSFWIYWIQNSENRAQWCVLTRPLSDYDALWSLKKSKSSEASTCAHLCYILHAATKSVFLKSESDSLPSLSFSLSNPYFLKSFNDAGAPSLIKHNSNFLDGKPSFHHLAPSDLSKVTSSHSLVCTLCSGHNEPHAVPWKGLALWGICALLKLLSLLTVISLTPSAWQTLSPCSTLPKHHPLSEASLDSPHSSPLLPLCLPN